MDDGRCKNKCDDDASRDGPTSATCYYYRGSGEVADLAAAARPARAAWRAEPVAACKNTRPIVHEVSCHCCRRCCRRFEFRHDSEE